MSINKVRLVCILSLYAMLLAPPVRAAGPARLVKDILLGPDSSNPSSLTNVNGTLFFWARDNFGYWLRKSDGTAAGTVPLRRMDSLLSDLTAMNGALYFVAYGLGTGWQLWRSDGTTTGTLPITDGLWPTYLTNVNGMLFFSAFGDGVGSQLWKSDGTTEGTVMVKDFVDAVGVSDSSIRDLVNVDGTLFFSAFSDGVGRELWKSDGTEAGTVLVKDINPGPNRSKISSPLDVNGTLFFCAYDGYNYGIWRSDGTTAGTRLIKHITPGPETLVPHTLTNVNGTVFFSAGTQDTGAELWKSDGTTNGTMLVKDISLSMNSSWIRGLVNLNGMLVFAADDEFSGWHLWRSDGSRAGTVRVKDDVMVDLPDQIIQARPDGRALFASYNATTLRRELWETDGTAEGTLSFQEIGPGTFDRPRDFTVAGSRVFFTANDGSTGNELWVIDNVDLGPPLLKDRTIVASNGPITGTLGFADTATYPLTYSIVANGGKGTAAITDAASGAFTYTPKPGARGRDRLTFKASDGKHESNVATVTVLLGPFAFLPTATR